MRTALFLLFTIFLHVESAKKAKDLVKEFNRNSKQATFGKEFKFYSLLVESKLSDDYDDFLDEFNKAAQKYENKVKFIFMNTDIEENWQAIEYLGLIAEDIPAVLFIVLDKGLTKYKMSDGEIIKANIEKFIDDCFEGKAISFAKTEDVPEDWDLKPVKQLVGKNFEENVFVKGKTSFVFFYAPWCTACQNAMPEVDKLGHLYNMHKNIMIAKVDSTANEVPKMPIFDVPTIALFLDGERKPIYYTDTVRTASAFSAFIKKHTTINEEATIVSDKDDDRSTIKEEEDQDKVTKTDEGDKIKSKGKKEEKTNVKETKVEKNKGKTKNEKEQERGKKTAEKETKKVKDGKKTKKQSLTTKDESKKSKPASEKKISQKSKKDTGAKKQNAKESSDNGSKGKPDKKQKTEL